MVMSYRRAVEFVVSKRSSDYSCVGAKRYCCWIRRGRHAIRRAVCFWLLLPNKHTKYENRWCEVSTRRVWVPTRFPTMPFDMLLGVNAFG